MPDFFDRLVARGLPFGTPPESAAGVSRVRPRVPALFERPQSALPDEPAAGAPPVPPGAVPLSATDPATVARHQPSGTPAPARAAPVAAEPRPAAEAVAGPVAVARALAVPGPVAQVPPAGATPPGDVQPSAHPAVPGRPGQPARGPTDLAPVIAAPPALVAPAVVRAPSTAAGPGTAGLPALGSAGRGDRGRVPERSVHVRIGRVEVTVPARPEPPSRAPRRRVPALTLETYLSGRPGERSEVAR